MNQNCSPAELVQKLSDGGWFVKSGSYADSLTKRLPITRVEISGNVVSLTTPDRSFEVPCDATSVSSSGGVIEIISGKHPGPSVVALRLTNPKVEYAFGKEHRKEVNRLRNEDQRRAGERKLALVGEVKSKLVGKRIVRVNVTGEIGSEGLCLDLEDDDSSTVESVTIELGHDWDDSWIEVEGTSLRDLI